jgi:hypothetical protein
MFLPFSAPLYDRSTPDKVLAIDETKMSLAVLKVAELRFLSISRHRANSG